MPELDADVIIFFCNSDNVGRLTVIVVVEDNGKLPFLEFGDDAVLNRFGVSLYPL